MTPVFFGGGGGEGEELVVVGATFLSKKKKRWLLWHMHMAKYARRLKTWLRSTMTQN